MNNNPQYSAASVSWLRYDNLTISLYGRYGPSSTHSYGLKD